MRYYGESPKCLGEVRVDCPEMLFYQYLPIKMAGDSGVYERAIERRLQFLTPFLGKVLCDYVAEYNLESLRDNYVYLTIKKMYQMPGCSFNREGWHSDGFMTNDVNYIWSDRFPTVFNTTKFELSPDDRLSLHEMTAQANPRFDTWYPNCYLLRLDQYNIHRVKEIDNPAMRTFIKVSFSRDKYDLLGNSHNYQLDYDWEMKKRGEARNIPQTTINNAN